MIELMEITPSAIGGRFLERPSTDNLVYNNARVHKSQTQRLPQLQKQRRTLPIPENFTEPCGLRE
jgi:hypothetical protein